MLDQLENRITALLGDRLAARTHLAVSAGGGTADGLSAGAGSVAVRLEEVSRTTFFAPRDMRLDAGTTRRVLPVQARLTVDFALRPAEPPGNPDIATARSLLLADVSVLLHAFGAAEIVDGRAFAPAAPDPGYFVHEVELQSAAIAPQMTGTLLRASLGWNVQVDIWPVGLTEDLGTIDAVDVFIGATPLRLTALRQRLRVGETTELRITGLPVERLVAVDAATRAPALLALRVESDLPQAERGRIASGTEGTEAGVRLIAAADGAWVAQYAAPTGALGTTRSETIAVHIATPEGGRGLFLGGLTVGLSAGASP